MCFLQREHHRSLPSLSCRIVCQESRGQMAVLSGRLLDGRGSDRNFENSGRMVSLAVETAFEFSATAEPISDVTLSFNSSLITRRCQVTVAPPAYYYCKSKLNTF